MQKIAIILASGSGERLKNSEIKPLVLVDQKPLF